MVKIKTNKRKRTATKGVYMCRRPESKAGPMISMPGGMNLCHDCMQKAFDSVTKGGMDFSKLPNMPYMNMNLNDLNMTPPAVEIPKKAENQEKSQGTAGPDHEGHTGSPCHQGRAG